MLKPIMPPYDIGEWRAKPFPERLRLVCLSWALQGYGTPTAIYSVYLLKVVFYVVVWAYFCSFSPGQGDLLEIEAWWFTPEALCKAVLWSIAFEGLGWGCGSGPLTGRYLPPFGGMLYFLRPGTTKMPLFPGLPLFGSAKRGLLDVALYIVHYGCLLRVLTAPEVTPELLLPTLIVLPLLGVMDKTLFLASRAEHYYAALVCFFFVEDWVAGTKIVWLAIWLWAATSKLNQHFPSVVCVMVSNSPLTRFGPLRKLVYINYPDDLRPSKLAVVLAHAGTVLEYSFPVALVLCSGGSPTLIALAVMLLFHLFITSNVPMGVPIEWNVIMVYGGFVLFGHHADASVLTIGEPVLMIFLVVALFLVPLIGNIAPAWTSFLCSMRYYAGNWPYSVWLFRGESVKKLKEHMVITAPLVEDQLRYLYDEDTITAVISKVLAFRAMHLQGRAVQLLLPRAVDDIDAYAYIDGEIVAGVVIGWNFGDGHLHNEQLLNAVQAQCNFEEGELRCIFVESQPMGGSSMAYRIADAATGPMEHGELEIDMLRDLQPWPTQN